MSQALRLPRRVRPGVAHHPAPGEVPARRGPRQGGRGLGGPPPPHPQNSGKPPRHHHRESCRQRLTLQQVQERLLRVQPVKDLEHPPLLTELRVLQADPLIPQKACATTSGACALPSVFIVPREARSDHPAVPGLACSIIGLLLVAPAFWSGLPIVLGAAGSALGQAGRVGGRTAGAIGVGIVAVVLDLLILLLDRLAQAPERNAPRSVTDRVGGFPGTPPLGSSVNKKRAGAYTMLRPSSYASCSPRFR